MRELATCKRRQDLVTAILTRSRLPDSTLSVIRRLVSITACLVLLANARADDPARSAEPAAAGGPTLTAGSLQSNRNAQPSLWIPPGEALEFRVDVDLGVLGDASVGTVTISSGVEPFVASLPLPGASLPEGGELVGWVRIAARGGHLGYELDHSITTRFLPQSWPSLINAEEQKGSENRRREVKIGFSDGQWMSSYRGNSHCPDCTRRDHFIKASLPWNRDYHCNGCRRAEHRFWNPPTERDVPVETTDIIGAVYLARSLVREGVGEFQLHMVQKEHLWNVKLLRGETKEITVPAGTFLCREVRLEVSQPPGEEDKDRKFSGLFGIKGALQIWLHEPTGVPVLIEGDVPVGDIIDLHASIRLTSHRETPAAFATVP